MFALRLLFLLLFMATACDKPVVAADKKGAPRAPVEVGVVTLAPTAVTLTRELPGRVSALRVAEVRARVSGIVEKRLFTEGSDVKEGQVLYRIEAAPFEASLASARANLARAEATLVRARSTAGRDEALLELNTVSREIAETSATALQAAQADVAAAKAAVQTAKINLDYTRVTAPVAGRIGRSMVTEGAYVQQSSATLMATIQQLDSVYVDVTQSATELLRLRRELETHQLNQAGEAAQATLILPDGRTYPEPGVLQFTDVTVDETTGSIGLRALFPNPRGELLAGMFVRARLEQGEDPQALLVPQRGVTRDPKGQATALVVGLDHKVERRQLVADRAIGNAWLVTEGLAPGDQVIVDGLQKVRPGAEVVAVPAAADPVAKTTAPAPAAVSANAPAPSSAPAKAAASGSSAPTRAAGDPATAAALATAASESTAPTKAVRAAVESAAN